MTKTAVLSGSEVKVSDLGGQNVAVKNLGDGSIYASHYPNVVAGADNVVEIPAGSGEVVLDAQGTVYLLGTGKAQCTGTPYATPNFKMPSSSASGGGGGTGGVSKSYVDAQDTTNLGIAKAYTDTQINSAKGDISQNSDDISTLQTGLSDLGAAVSTNTVDISALQTDMTAAQAGIAANTTAIASNSNAINNIQADVATADSKADAAQAAIDNLADKSVVSMDGAFDLRYVDNKLQANVSGTWSDISTGGGGESGVSQDYVDTHDATTLTSANAYTDAEIAALKEDVDKNADDISELQDDLTSTTATAEAAQAAADTNSENIITMAESTLNAAKSYTDTKTSDFDDRITQNTNAISTLNGTGEGSVKKAVSDGIAEVVADAPESLDTLQEISDWITSHPDSAAAMNSQIQDNTNAIDSLRTDVTTAQDDIEANKLAIEELQNSEYELPTATATELGGVKIGYEANGKNYPVKLNDAGQMYVTVPEGGGGDDNNPDQPIELKIMTAIIDLANSNPETSVTYADDAIGMEPGSAEWDDFFGHYPCLLKNGQEVGKLQRDDFNKFEDGSTADISSGNAGDVMIAFPRRGLSIKTVGNTIYVSMTNDPNNSNFEYNAHTRGTTAKDVFYLGVYKGFTSSSKLRSLKGKPVTANQTIGTFRTQARANGNGYEQSGFYQLTYRQAMFILKYKSLDSQTAVGQGYVKSGHTEAIATGGTEAWGMDCELIKNSNPTYMTDKEHHVKCFGIEDFWGNVWEWIDGLVSDSSRNVLTANSNFNDTGSGYINNGNGGVPDNVDGWMSKPQGTTKAGFVTKEARGSATTYFCDCAYLYDSCVACFGGNWYDDTNVGAFYLYGGPETSYSNADVGARLMFL